jgi:phosphatidylglycerol:prolipoprotein diacylglycerol transferase
MKQIIIDFGTLDFSSMATWLRIVGYLAAAMAAGLFAWASLSHAPQALRGKVVKAALRYTVLAGLVIGVLLLRDIPLHIVAYLAIAVIAYWLAQGLFFVLAKSKAPAPTTTTAHAPAGTSAVMGAMVTLFVIIAAIAVILEFAHFSFTIRIFGYGLMLVLGFLVSIGLAQWRARRMGEDTDIIAHVGVLSVIGGIVGARAAFVIQDWDRFSKAGNPIFEMINVTSGGLIYYGGLILASLVVIVYLIFKRVPVRRYLDILAVSIMVGLAFGRAGCLLNGCCYGADCRADFALATKFPMYSKPLLKLDSTPGPFSNGADLSPVYEHQFSLGKVSPDPRLFRQPTSRPSGTIAPWQELVPPKQMTADQMQIAEQEYSNPVKPSQALGIANALILACLLAMFFRLRSREGQVFALLAIMYPITRFIEELIRDDNAHDLLRGVLTHNQYTSVGLFAVGIAMMFILRLVPACAGAGMAERLSRAKAIGSTSATRKPKRK